jgi:hypothetical protein
MSSPLYERQIQTSAHHSNMENTTKNKKLDKDKQKRK